MQVKASGRARFTSDPLRIAHACASSPREDPQPGDFQAPSMGLREGAEADALREPLKQARPLHYPRVIIGAIFVSSWQRMTIFPPKSSKNDF